MHDGVCSDADRPNLQMTSAKLAVHFCACELAELDSLKCLGEGNEDGGGGGEDADPPIRKWQLILAVKKSA